MMTPIRKFGQSRPMYQDFHPKKLQARGQGMGWRFEFLTFSFWIFGPIAGALASGCAVIQRLAAKHDGFLFTTIKRFAM